MPQRPMLWRVVANATRHPQIAQAVSLAGGVLLSLWLLLPHPTAAQGNFEIQVYGADTVPPGQTMLELHSNTALKGTTQPENGIRPTQHAAHETLEITHGFTPWFETGFYLFTSIQPHTGWEWVGDHIRPRIRVPESWQVPVGLSLSLEAGYQQRAFSTDTWTLEIRPIIDKQFGPWYASFNPAFERSLKGASVSRGFEFSPNVKVSYDLTQTVTAGLEYYGGIGPVTAFDPLKQQQHLLFPALDLNLGPRWEFNFGVGFGLTPSTDRLLLKLILGYRFNVGAGSRP
jgi:Putative MetA-pathway of phenol degradation